MNNVLIEALRLQTKYHPDVLSRNLTQDGVGGAFIVDMSSAGANFDEYRNLIRHLYGAPNVEAHSEDLTIYFAMNGQQLLVGLYDMSKHCELSSKILVGGESATPYICDSNSTCYLMLQKLTKLT